MENECSTMHFLYVLTDVLWYILQVQTTLSLLLIKLGPFLHIDEITEGIDPLGLKLLMKSLECFDFPILVTTHVMNVVYPEVLMVVKEFGISKIEKENYAND